MIALYRDFLSRRGVMEKSPAEREKKSARDRRITVVSVSAAVVIALATIANLLLASLK